MDGFPVEELEQRLEASHRVTLDLSIRRVRKRIDRALDLRNQREFHLLCNLLRDYQSRR